jgi:ferredoxin
MIPIIDSETCTGCGTCVEVCPPQAITLKEDTAQLEEEFCEECGFCAAHCPVNAIEIPFPLSTWASEQG